MTCPFCKGPTTPVHAKSRFHRCAWCGKDMPDYLCVLDEKDKPDEKGSVKPKGFLEKLFG